MINLSTISPVQHELAKLDAINAGSLQAFANAARLAFQTFWNNPHATPQEMAAGLGTNAAAAFQMHAETVAFILHRNPALLAAEDYTPPLPYTFLADGSLQISTP